MDDTVGWSGGIRYRRSDLWSEKYSVVGEETAVCEPVGYRPPLDLEIMRKDEIHSITCIIWIMIFFFFPTNLIA